MVDKDIDYKAQTSSDMERKIKIMIENDIPQRIHIPGLGRKYISRKMIDDLKKEGGIYQNIKLNTRDIQIAK